MTAKPKPKQSGSDRAKRYKERRLRLVFLLGAICLDCGETDLEKLELDGKNGHTRTPSKLSRWTRVRMYELDFLEGNLAVRCRRCNARKGSDCDDDPF